MNHAPDAPWSMRILTSLLPVLPVSLAAASAPGCCCDMVGADGELHSRREADADRRKRGTVAATGCCCCDLQERRMAPRITRTMLSGHGKQSPAAQRQRRRRGESAAKLKDRLTKKLTRGRCDSRVVRCWSGSGGSAVLLRWAPATPRKHVRRARGCPTFVKATVDDPGKRTLLGRCRPR